MDRKYLILEVQVNADGTVGTVINSYTDKNVAESNYHRVLMAAAISSLPVHTAYMLTESGQTLKSECYIHDVSESEAE